MSLGNMLRFILRAVIFGGAALLLTGCDTFGLGGAAQPAAPAARPLDYRADDLGSVVFALDLPAGVQPVTKATQASFDVSTETKGSRHIKAILVLADGDSVDGALPPPAPGRTYYLLGFADRDKTALSDAQKWLAALPPTAAPVIAFAVTPKLCETAALDPSIATVSVLPALAGAGPLRPLVAGEPLVVLLNGGQLPPCSSV